MRNWRRSRTVRIRKPGRVKESLWFLGSEETGVYLLEGRQESMIISGGMSYIVPDLLQQMTDFNIDERRITKLLILHSHFDHIGIVPFLKRRLSQIEIYASERAWEILTMEKAIRTINEFSRSVARRMKREGVYSVYDLEWRDDITGKLVHDGDRIDLGEVTVSIVEIPGHSSCSIAAYVPEWKALFPTDGGGIPFRETIITSGNSNYTQYQESLEKLKDLEVDYYCADHYGYLTGEEAGEFVPKTIEMARDHRAAIEKAYRSTGDIDKAAKAMVNSFYHENRGYFLSPEIFLEVYRQMVRHIASAMEGNALP
jgi:glyoxylase-like metal-dependent hydrolase (beta-lactamase superfamily II)